MENKEKQNAKDQQIQADETAIKTTKETERQPEPEDQVKISEKQKEVQETQAETEQSDQAIERAIDATVENDTQGLVKAPESVDPKDVMIKSNKVKVISSRDVLEGSDVLTTPIVLDDYEKWNSEDSKLLNSAEQAFNNIPAENEFEGLSERSSKPMKVGGDTNDNSFHNIAEPTNFKQVVTGSFNVLPDHDARQRGNGNVIIQKGTNLVPTGAVYFDDPKHMRGYGAQNILFNSRNTNRIIEPDVYKILRRGLYVLEGFRPIIGDVVKYDDTYHKEIESTVEKDGRTVKSSYIDDSHALFVVRDVTPLVKTITQATRDTVTALTAIKSRENSTNVARAINASLNEITRAQTMSNEALAALEYMHAEGVSSLVTLNKHPEISCSNNPVDLNRLAYDAWQDQVMIDAMCAANLTNIKERIHFDKRIEGRQSAENSYWYNHDWQMNTQRHRGQFSMTRPGLLNVAAGLGSPRIWNTSGKIMVSFTRIWQELDKLRKLFDEENVVHTIDANVKMFKQAYDDLVLALTPGVMKNHSEVNHKAYVVNDVISPVLSFNPNDCVEVVFEKTSGKDNDPSTWLGTVSYKPRLYYKNLRSVSASGDSPLTDTLYWNPLWIHTLISAMALPNFKSKVFNDVYVKDGLDFKFESYLNDSLTGARNYIPIKYDHTKFNYFSYIYANAIVHASEDVYAPSEQVINGVWRWKLTMADRIYDRVKVETVSGTEFIKTFVDKTREMSKLRLKKFPEIEPKRHMDVISNLRYSIYKIISGPAGARLKIEGPEGLFDYDGVMASILRPTLLHIRQPHYSTARAPYVELKSSLFGSGYFNNNFRLLKSRYKLSTPEFPSNIYNPVIMDMKINEGVETTIINHVFSDVETEKYNMSEDLLINALTKYDGHMIIEPCNYYIPLVEQGGEGRSNFSTYCPVVDDEVYVSPEVLKDPTVLLQYSLRRGEKGNINYEFVKDTMESINSDRLVNAATKCFTSLPSLYGYTLPASLHSSLELEEQQKLVSGLYNVSSNAPKYDAGMVGVRNIISDVDITVGLKGDALSGKFRNFQKTSSSNSQRRSISGLNNVLMLANGTYKFIYPRVQVLDDTVFESSQGLDLSVYMDRNFIYEIPAFNDKTPIDCSGTVNPIALTDLFNTNGIRVVELHDNPYNTVPRIIKNAITYKDMLVNLPPLSTLSYPSTEVTAGTDLTKQLWSLPSYSYINWLFWSNVNVVDYVNVACFLPFYVLNNTDWHNGNSIHYEQFLKS